MRMDGEVFSKICSDKTMLFFIKASRKYKLDPLVRESSLSRAKWLNHSLLIQGKQIRTSRIRLQDQISPRLQTRSGGDQGTDCGFQRTQQ